MENNQKRNYRVVGAPVVKKDAKALVTGKPVYTDDLALKDCLIVKVLRSPYAHALITEIPGLREQRQKREGLRS